MAYHFQDTMIKYIMRINYLFTQFRNKRDLIFDLDNTLIDEKEYLYSAYLEIAKKADFKKSTEIFNYLKITFKNSGRKNIYQKMVEEFKLKNLYLQDFLNILRTHKPKNKFLTLPWFDNWIKLISCEFPIYLITNGNFIQQKNKINNLILPNGSYFKKVIFATKYQHKPSSKSFQLLDKEFKLNDPIYIGDSEIDMQFAKNSFIEFINVNELINNF